MSSTNIISDAHNLSGAGVDPAFVDPESANFGIGPRLSALDNALDLGITADLDGVPRPLGDGPDRGVYETCARVFLPLLMRDQTGRAGTLADLFRTAFPTH